MFPVISINDVYLSLKIVFILANSADLDEMLPYAAFHLGLHCLSKYLFIGIQNEKSKGITILILRVVLLAKIPINWLKYLYMG